MSFFVFLHAMHYRLAFIGIIYGLGRSVKLALWITPLSLVLDYTAVGLQYIIAQERPYPGCVPFYMYEFGMPAPEIVTVSSVTVGMICTLIYKTIAKRRRRERRHIGSSMVRRSKRKKTLWKRVYYWLDWAYWVFAVAVTVAICIAHPIYMVLFHIVSVPQAIVSAIVGALGTVIIYFAVGSFVNWKL